MVRVDLVVAKEEGGGRGGADFAGSGCLLTEGGGADVSGSSCPLMVRVDLVIAKEEGGGRGGADFAGSGCPLTEGGGGGAEEGGEERDVDGE